MGEKMKGVLRIVVMSLVLLLVYYCLNYLGYNTNLHPAMPWIVLFYCIQSSAIHSLLSVAKKSLDAEFSVILIGGFTLRLVTALMVVVIVVFAGIENYQMYIINFFAVYLLYLVFEIVTVLPNLRSNCNTSK